MTPKTSSEERVAHTPQQIAKLKELAEEATPGPWKWFVEVKIDPNHTGHFPKMKTVEWNGDWGKYEFGPDFEGLGQRPGESVVMGNWHNDSTAGLGVSSKADAEFLAAANPSTILSLLAERESLVDALRAARQKHVKVATWLEMLAEQAEDGASRQGRFQSLRDAYLSDAKNYRATAADIKTTIVEIDAALSLATVEK